MSARAPEPPESARQPELPRAGYLLLAALTLFWGANWPGMKLALAEIPVWWFRSICLICGGAGLLALAWASGQRLRVPRNELRPLLICAVFNVVGWHIFSGYGVSLMPAGRASIIAFTMPLWAALLGSLVLGDRLTLRRLLGLAVGLSGLAVLIGPDLRAAQAAPFGAFFMLGAALSWAAGTISVKHFAWSLSTAVLAGWQLIAGFVVVFPVALLLETPPEWTGLSTGALISLAYVIALPMLFCQWAYIKVVRLFPAVLAAIGTLAIPVVGVFSSALVLGEAVGPRDFASLALVCGALAIVLLPAARRRAAT
jgi:drug/metabolite transporter (DMT)-like permease